jgi:hypothetical protein
MAVLDDARNQENPGIGAPAGWHKPREVREGIGLLLITIALGWIIGQIAAAILLNEAVLAFLGVVP